MHKYLHRLLLPVLCLAASACLAAPQDVGIVVMHGKWDRAPTHVHSLAQQLAAEGFLVSEPMMPWSGPRQYDVPYPQAIAEIESAVQTLRDKGARHIVVGGLSFGANGALAYAASGKPVDAVFALSPGHRPEYGPLRKSLEPSVNKARSMIEAGHGKDTAWFDDKNLGKTRQIQTSAEAYLSYFDPEGLGAMTRTAPALPKGMPLFMAIGTADPTAEAAKETLFDVAPQNDQNVFKVLETDHVGVAPLVGPALAAWIHALWH